jgi:hypothetical protein
MIKKMLLSIAYAGDNRVTNVINSPGDVINLATKIGGYLYTLIIALSVVVVLIGAFNILTSGGDEKKFLKGKNQILYAAAAIAISVLATGIVRIVEDLVSK